MAQTPSTFLLRGGLNLVTPPIAVPAGMAIAAVNYVPDVKGYSRIGGYERYDGLDRPSAAQYWVINFDQGSAAISEGDAVTGATSSATGKALIDAVVTSGSYGGGDAVGYLVLTAVTGTFADDENLQVSAATKCVADGTANLLGALTDENNTTWLKDAVDTQRALIAKVPGSGAVRGVHELNGDLYAIRDNAGATAGILHKATTGGWSAQDLGYYLDFTAAAAGNGFVEGETVTGGTSGATAIVRRVVLESGAYDSSGAGRLTVSDITGTFQAAETLTGGTSTQTATNTAAQAANALPAGGRYDFVVHNFYGAGKSKRLYGCAGVGPAWEWDGTYFTECRTGLDSALDKPTHVGHYKEHLFLSVAGGAMEHSEIGEPLQFKTTGGAGEIPFGSDITNFISDESTTLLVFGRNHIGYMTGTDASTFDLDKVSERSGAVEWTAQPAGNPVYLDDAGLREMTTTQAFGNWRLGTISQAIEPLFRSKSENSVSARASVLIRAKDQYRLFFDDKTGVTVYLGRDTPELMPFQLEHAIYCTCTGKVNSEANESIFAGTDDGYVMELERGRSFDGETISAFVRLAFNNVGSPTQLKCWAKTTLQCEASPQASLYVVAEFGYGDPYNPPGVEQNFTLQSGGGLWDESNWNQFYWSSQIIGQAEAHTEGLGENISLAIMSDADFEESHTLSSLTLNFTYRGVVR